MERQVEVRLTDQTEIVCDGSDGGYPFHEFANGIRWFVSKDKGGEGLSESEIDEVDQQIDDANYSEEEALEDLIELCQDRLPRGDERVFGWHPEMPGCLVIALPSWFEDGSMHSSMDDLMREIVQEGWLTSSEFVDQVKYRIQRKGWDAMAERFREIGHAIAKHNPDPKPEDLPKHGG